MTYTIDHEEDKNILRINVSGKTNEKDFLSLSQEVLNIVQLKSPTKVLIDIRKLEGRLGVFETFNLVLNYPDIVRRLKIALVDSVKNKEYYSFHEMVAQNRGFKISFFNRISTAETWLRH